ncbi:Endo-1,4-beta-xylanase A precursor [compost metagenome]
MKIPLKTVSPANNVKIGFDAQINDAKDGARQSVAAWNDTTGNGYQDTSVYGVLTLAGKGPADTTPPVLKITASPAVLSTPNHKLVPIRISWKATDAGSGLASIKLVSITSNESDNGLGDGDKPNDIQGADIGTADQEFQLRAERSGKGNGRIYTITYEATDKAGNKTTANTTVQVPKGKKK